MVRFQFTIDHLMRAVAVIAAALALGRWVGYAAELFLAWNLGLAWGTYSTCVRQPRWISRVYLGSVLILGLAAVATLGWAGPVPAIAAGAIGLILLYPAMLGCGVAVMAGFPGRGEEFILNREMIGLLYLTFVPMPVVVPVSGAILLWMCTWPY